MIIFDTNVLRQTPVTGTACAVLRAITEDAGIPLAISSVTLDEYRAQRLRDAQARIDAARNAHESLCKVATDWRPPKIDYPSADKVISRDIESVQSVFQTLPLAPESATEALRREAYRELPASTDPKKSGSGARDVAIWLTAIEASRSSGNVVYFVSGDSRAFGDKRLHQQLTADAADKGANIILCPDVATIIEQFATKTDLDLDLATVLSNERVKDAVAEAMNITSFPAAADAVDADGREGLVSGGRIGDVKLSDCQEARAYKIRGETWIAAHTTWAAGRDLDQQLYRSDAIRQWRIDLEQEITLLLRVLDEAVVKATVMGWKPPLIKAASTVEDRVWSSWVRASLAAEG
jgi:hypothetical protein